MNIDLFIILCRAIILFIYGGIFIIAIIFTFFIDRYRRLDELLNIELLSMKTVNPLYANISLIDDWLQAHHLIVGFILSLLSILDIVMLFKLTDLLL